jgi:hypothetical protein
MNLNTKIDIATYWVCKGLYGKRHGCVLLRVCMYEDNNSPNSAVFIALNNAKSAVKPPNSPTHT